MIHMNYTWITSCLLIFIIQFPEYFAVHLSKKHRICLIFVQFFTGFGFKLVRQSMATGPRIGDQLWSLRDGARGWRSGHEHGMSRDVGVLQFWKIRKALKASKSYIGNLGILFSSIFQHFMNCYIVSYTWNFMWFSLVCAPKCALAGWFGVRSGGEGRDRYLQRYRWDERSDDKDAGAGDACRFWPSELNVPQAHMEVSI